MKYEIRVSLLRYDSDVPELRVKMSGVSENIVLKVLESYSGVNFLIDVFAEIEKEEEEE